MSRRGGGGGRGAPRGGGRGGGGGGGSGRGGDGGPGFPPPLSSLRVQKSYPAFGRDSCQTHGHALDACLPHQRSHICDPSNAERGRRGASFVGQRSPIGLLRRPISKKTSFQYRQSVGPAVRLLRRAAE